MQALAELHADEDFQRDAATSYIQDIIDEIKAKPEAMEKCGPRCTSCPSGGLLDVEPHSLPPMPPVLPWVALF